MTPINRSGLLAALHSDEDPVLESDDCHGDHTRNVLDLVDYCRQPREGGEGDVIHTWMVVCLGGTLDRIRYMHAGTGATSHSFPDPMLMLVGDRRPGNVRCLTFLSPDLLARLWFIFPHWKTAPRAVSDQLRHERLLRGRCQLRYS